MPSNTFQAADKFLLLFNNFPTLSDNYGHVYVTNYLPMDLMIHQRSAGIKS